MKPSLLLIKRTFICALLLWCQASNAQGDSIAVRLTAKIEQYQKQDSFMLYYSNIAELVNYYWDKGHREKIVEIYSLYGVYRAPKTENESYKIRKYYAFKLYSYRKSSGNFHKALEIGKEAEKYVWNKDTLDDRANYIENVMGSIYARLDDYDNALLYYKKCIPSYQKGMKHKLALLYCNIGDVHKWKQDNEMALQYFQDALNIGNHLNHPKVKIAAQSRMRTLALEEGDYENFVTLAKQSEVLIDLNTEDKSNPKRKSILESEWGEYYEIHKQYDLAISHYSSSKNILLPEIQSDIKREIAKIQVNLAACYRLKNDFPRAYEEINTGMEYLIPGMADSTPLKEQLYPENTFFELYEEKYKIAFRDYNETENIALESQMNEAIDHAIYVNELINEQHVYSQSLSISTRNTRSLLNAAIDITYLTYKREKSADAFFRLRNLLNQSKNLILNDRQKLKAAILGLSPKKKARVDSLSQLILLATRNNEQTKLISYHNQVKNIIGTQKHNEKQQGFSSDYIEYVMTDNQVYAMYVLNGIEDFALLGEKKMYEKLFVSLTQNIRQKGDLEQLQNTLNKMGELLLPDVLLPPRFTVIPDGSMAALPYDLLIRDKEYLIHQHEIQFETQFMTAKKAKKKEIKSVICLNPAYDKLAEGDMAEMDRGELFQLPFAKEEVKTLSNIFHKTMQLGHQDDASTMSKRLKEADLFHFTGHAKVHGDSAYLVLDTKRGLEKWTFQEIYQDAFDLSLVTLSACETGLGQYQYGDGLNSVARSFIASGTESVVYSLWAVNDRSTYTIMDDFYQNLQKGNPIDISLRKAKLEYLESCSLENRHPYYWSGFVACGDMSPLYIDKNYSSYLLYLSIGLILLAVLYFLIYKTKKHETT